MMRRMFATTAVSVLIATAQAGAFADEKRADEIVQGKCFICHGADG